MNENLPPLPEPFEVWGEDEPHGCITGYTAAQMQAYARTALAAQPGAVGGPGQGKELHDRLIQAIHTLMAARDEPVKWGNVGPDAEDLAWDKVRELVNYICVGIDSPPCLAAAPTEAKPAPGHCPTCNDHGMIGGPSFYAPDEGGVPCPDCTEAKPAQQDDETQAVLIEGVEYTVPMPVAAEMLRLHLVGCDAQTAISPCGSRSTKCGSDQMRRAVSEGHAFNTEAKPAQDAVPDGYTKRVIEALQENGDPVSVDAAEEMQRLLDLTRPAQDAVDDLQGAANWLGIAIDRCDVSDIQQRLSIGYNRARRLLDAAISAKKGG